MARRLLIALVTLGMLTLSVSAVLADGRRASEPQPKSTPRAQNRMAAALAEAFGVSVDEIEAWHTAGFGYGEIGKAYALTAKAGVKVDSLFARHEAGEGWGVIASSLGFTVKGGGVNVRVEPAKAKPHGEDENQNSNKHGNPNKNDKKNKDNHEDDD